MRQFGKKTIILTYLTIYLFGLVLPFDASHAQTLENPLVISASKTTIRPGETTRITAIIPQQILGPLNSATINFPNLQIRGGTFTPPNCTVTRSGGLVNLSCFVDFSSINAGSFAISAWITTDRRYDSNVIPITVANTIVINPPTLDPDVLILRNAKTNINTGEKTRIRALILSQTVDFGGPNGNGSAVVSFSSSGGTFIPATCTITKTGGVFETSVECSVEFFSNTAGSFNLSASTVVGGAEGRFPIVRVIVTGPTITPPPPPPPESKPPETAYKLLAPLPGLDEIIETDPTKNSCPLGKYLNVMIKLILGISAVLAMVMIVMGGIEYMTSELVSGKEAGKERIVHAVLGLLIALGAYLILNTINPRILETCLNFPVVNIEISSEQEKIIINRGGGVGGAGGKCEVITDPNSNCYPDKLRSYFTGNTSASAPFNTLAAQASAICQLESSAVADMPVGLSPDKYLDKCSDNKPFSFGLFQINASAHRENIKDNNGNQICLNAFEIPAGHGRSQGNPTQKVKSKNGREYTSQWSCITKEPAYTVCKNFLINPINNIKFAATSPALNRWNSWTTYTASCKSKF